MRHNPQIIVKMARPEFDKVLKYRHTTPQPQGSNLPLRSFTQSSSFKQTNNSLKIPTMPFRQRVSSLIHSSAYNKRREEEGTQLEKFVKLVKDVHRRIEERAEEWEENLRQYSLANGGRPEDEYVEEMTGEDRGPYYPKPFVAAMLPRYTL